MKECQFGVSPVNYSDSVVSSKTAEEFKALIMPPTFEKLVGHIAFGTNSNGALDSAAPSAPSNVPGIK